MEHTRDRQPSSLQSAYLGPGGPVLLAPATECPSPEPRECLHHRRSAWRSSRLDHGRRGPAIHHVDAGTDPSTSPFYQALLSTMLSFVVKTH
jgi:hypothetical protein